MKAVKRVKWQHSFTRVDIKIRRKAPRSPSKALEPSTGHQTQKTPETLASALRLPPRHICLQAIILDVHVAVVSTKPHWHEVSGRKESSQFFLLANLARKGKKALRCVTSTYKGVEGLKINSADIYSATPGRTCC